MNYLVNLAPIFDQISSLSRQLLDSKKENKINNKIVKNYVAKLRLVIYDKRWNRKAMLTLDVFEKLAYLHLPTVPLQIRLLCDWMVKYDDFQPFSSEIYKSLAVPIFS